MRDTLVGVWMLDNIFCCWFLLRSLASFLLIFVAEEIEFVAEEELTTLVRWCVFESVFNIWTVIC